MTSEYSPVALRPRAHRTITAFAIISISLGLGWPRVFAASRDDKRQAAVKLISAPLSFEPNQGQAASTIQFLSRGSGYALFLAPGKVVLDLEQQQPASVAAPGRKPESASVDTLRMSLIGANPKANAVGLAPQSGVVSYFIGNDPKTWRTGIPTYAKVNYAQVYPGVDLVFYGNQRELEYDFVVSPGADPSMIAWRIDGARASVDAGGNLVLRVSRGPAVFRKPVVYQAAGGRKTSVEGSFTVAGNRVSFRVGEYDHSRPLVIDPVLSYATYLGGTNTDNIGNTLGPGILGVGASQGIAVDIAGSAYVTGTTYSVDFPTKNPYQGAPPTKLPGVSPGKWPSAFVTKFSPDGSSLIYSTYLGGNGLDYGYAIAVDSAGSAYVAGSTTSPNFPATGGAYQTVCAPIPNNTGIGASASNCNSADYNVFVTKLNPAGNGLVYSTFLGGYGNGSYATAIALDSAGRAYVAGNENTICQTSYTFQACFPTTSGAIIGGNLTGGRSSQYAFVAVFDPNGAKLLYSTLFGDLNFECGSGCGETLASGVTVDANGYFYLIGATKAGRLPTTTGVIQATTLLDPTGVYSPAYRGFVAKFSPVTGAGGVTLAYATYLGGHTSNTSDYLSGIAIDSAGYAYLAGYTDSNDFPVTSGAYTTVCAPGGGTFCHAAHVTKLNPSGTAIVWSTYVGGSKQDGSDDLFFTGPIQLDGKGNIYIEGWAGPGFPLLYPVEPQGNGGSQEVTVVELDPTGSKVLFATRIGSNGLENTQPAGLAVDAAGNMYVAGNTNGPDLVTTPGAFQTKSSDGPCCGLGNGFVAKIAQPPGPQITAGSVFNAATLQSGGIAPNEFISIKGIGLGPATGVSSDLTKLLAGAAVYINGTPTYLAWAQDGQVNAIVPFGVAGTQSATIQCEYNGVKGNTVTVPVADTSPGIFTQAYGPGQAWVVNQDGTFNSSSNQAPRNSYVAFWITGQGNVTPPLADGVAPTGPPFPAPVLPVNVTLGGVPIPAANIVFVGLVYSGIAQINVQIPANAPTGSALPLAVTIGSGSSRTDVTIAIQ